MIDKISKLVATFFYVGCFPCTPGTIASFAGLLLYLSVSPSLKSTLFVFIVIAAFGFIFSGRAERVIGKKDPHEIVIDEVCGIFLVFINIPLNIISILSGFILYRLFDILKPFPLKKLEKLHGSIGIMADDIVAGIYANIVLLIFYSKVFRSL